MADLAQPSPVVKAQRISTIDTIRGVAVLGTLLMNIVSFGLPKAYDDPTIAGGATGWNLIVWFWNQILFEGKMRAMFSILFGAGLVLMWWRVKDSPRELGFADIYLRRNLWLMAFGILHAFLIWEGDILFYYGAAGLMLYTFRNVSAKWLLSASLGFTLILCAKSYVEAVDRNWKRDAAARADAIAAQGGKLTPEQEEVQAKWKEKIKELKPSAEDVKKNDSIYRSGYWRIFLDRQQHVPAWESLFFYLYTFWDVAGAMLLGMALMKLGMLDGRLSARTYALLAVAGYTVGFGIISWIALKRIAANFDIVAGAYLGTWYEMSRLPAAIGHIAVVVLASKTPALGWIVSRLAAVGQMALTNYLLTSIICSIIFYGYGFGLIGQLERYQLYYVVAAVWTAQLIWSPIWLTHFQFGPMEWVWRSMTYWKRQPMRYAEELAASATATA